MNREPAPSVCIGKATLLTSHILINAYWLLHGLWLAVLPNAPRDAADDTVGDRHLAE